MQIAFAQSSEASRNRKATLVSAAIVTLLCIVDALSTSMSAAAVAADWPHWRGPNRDGVSSESSGWNGKTWLPQSSAWDARVGAGGSAPIVVDGSVYTIGWSDGRDHVVCLDAGTGKEIWQQSYEAPKYSRNAYGDQGLYSGTSASPSFDPQSKLLYTLGSDGDLNCWDTTKSGQKVWSVNFFDAYEVAQRPLVGTRRLRDYGYTSSPLVSGDWIIAEVGDDEGNLFAFDKRTGRRVWTSQSKDPAGHTGGLVPIIVEKIPCVAVLTIRNLLIARLDSGHAGETLAEFPWETDFANSIATPAVLGNSVIITSEYNQYSICRVEISKAGAREVWKQPYASGVSSPIIHRDHIYWSWRGVYCIDFETGKPLWRGGIFGDTASCIVTSDDRLIVWADHGELLLVETAVRSPKKYTELDRRRGVFRSDVWPHIVLSNGRLFCKDRDGNVKCFELAAAASRN